MANHQIIVLRTTHRACTYIVSTEGAAICMVVYPGLRLKGPAKIDALNCLPYSVCCSWETIMGFG